MSKKKTKKTEKKAPPKKQQFRSRTCQLNFRCTETEKEAYEALSEELEMPMSAVFRYALAAQVEEHLGEGWLEDEEE